MTTPTPQATVSAAVHVDPLNVVAEVDPRLFGSFLEHLGRAVYTGVYEPDHPSAGSDGLRRDVLDLIRELGCTVVRYPGGNFVSGYRWEDGIGPAEQRPRRLELAWRSLETNQFGLDEFMRFTRASGTEAMLAVNLGTRGVLDAVDMLEYCNHPGGTAWSDARRRHADADPYGVRLWCLGNEMDGPWQIGHTDADAYGKLAAATARAMRQVDPDVQLVACGSSGRQMPTFGAWESTVLEHCFDVVDMISCHAYYQERGGDVDSFLASGHDMDAYIEGVVATADHIAARRRSDKRITISFDEWNVWYMDRKTVPAPGPWSFAPRLLENVYSVTDAVVVGGLLISLLNHSDRVAAACLAQLVNVIAPIMTEPGGPAWRQTTFYPFALTARHGRGRVLRVAAQSPSHDTAQHGTVPLLQSTAVYGEDGTLTLFAVNRDTTRPMSLTADLRQVPVDGPVEHLYLADQDRHASNTLAEPDRVTPRQGATVKLDGGMLQAELPPLSWNVIHVRP